MEKEKITMGRKPHSNYVGIAQTVLSEVGGGPMSSRDLVAAAQERGLVGNGKWVYNNFLRKIRESEEFDTSRRGFVALATTENTPEVEVPIPDLVMGENSAGQDENANGGNSFADMPSE